MRSATIIRRFGTGTRPGIAISVCSVQLPWFPTLLAQHSQHWRCFHEYRRLHITPPIALGTSESFSRERTARSCSTAVLPQSRQYHATSILGRYKANSKRRKAQRARALAEEEESRLNQPEPDPNELEISINNQILAFGKDGQWREILKLHQDQKPNFNASNYSTVMSQLSHIQQVRRNDRLVEAFVADLNTMLQEHGIPWLGGVRQLSTIVHAVAKLGLQPQRNSSAKGIMTFMAADETAEWLFNNKEPRGIANCVWACGKLGSQAPRLFQLLDQRADWLFRNGNSKDIANSVWACGALGIEATNLFTLLDQRAEWLFTTATPQGISNCVWACGALRIDAPKLFKLLDYRAEWLFENGTSQNIANCIWACGKLGIKAPKLFKLLDQRAEWLMDNGKPQEVSNCVWACGTLGNEAPKLFQLLDQRAEWLFEHGSPQNIANCAWACGILGIEVPKLFLLLNQRAEWMMENGNPQNIANCSWACGTLGIESPKLFQLLDKRPEWLFEHGNPQDVSNCLWACGTLGIEIPALFKLFDERAEWLMEHGNAQSIANSAWALAVLGTFSPIFFSALERNLDKVLIDSNARDLCNVCYAIAVHDHDSLNQRDLLSVLWTNLLDRKSGDLPDEALTQIIYVQTFSLAYGIHLVSPSEDLQRRLDEVTFTTQSSTFETNVSNALFDVGFAHQREVSPLKSMPGLLSIDIACRDRMVAIECDGPSHYLSILGDDERRENGPTKAKRRLLQRLGWNVINLNLAEAYQRDLSKEWLKEKLLEGGVNL